MSAVAKAIGRLGQRRGRESERAALEAISANMPEWMTSVRAATDDEDRRGIDIVASTDVGDVYLQVKSSVGAAKDFRRDPRRRNIAVAVVRIGEPYDIVGKRCVNAIAALRAEYRRW